MSTEQRDIDTPYREWRSFPANVDDWNWIAFRDDPRANRLHELADSIFYKKTVEVELIETDDDLSAPQLYNNEHDLLQKLAKTSSRGLSILSIGQDNSLSKLDITYEAMLKILTMRKISPDFLSVALKFGKQPQVFEEGSTVISLSEPFEKCLDISYQYTYMQLNGRPPPHDPWSLRQTGVYQRIDHRHEKTFSHCIILHPTPLDKSDVEIRLKNLLASSSARDQINSNPLNLHFLILACFIHNWQVYLEGLADEFRLLRGRVAEIDIDNKDDYDLRTSSLRKLKEIEDRLLFRVVTNVRSNLSIVETIEKVNRRLADLSIVSSAQYSQAETCLQSFKGRLRSHQSSAETLEKRLVATIGLLSNLLDLKNQKTTKLINDNMLTLTRETVDDNATIFVISLVTLIYLPSQWVATLLGSNLFEFDNTTGGFSASHSTWIYFAIAAPLTALTVIAWRIQVKQQRKYRDQQRQKMQDL